MTLLICIPITIIIFAIMAFASKADGKSVLCCAALEGVGNSDPAAEAVVAVYAMNHLAGTSSSVHGKKQEERMHRGAGSA